MSFADLIDGIIARMSCKGAVKAARPMRPEEAAALVEELEKTPGRWTCPHGRPIMLVMGVGPCGGGFSGVEPVFRMKTQMLLTPTPARNKMARQEKGGLPKEGS